MEKGAQNPETEAPEHFSGMRKNEAFRSQSLKSWKRRKRFPLECTKTWGICSRVREGKRDGGVLQKALDEARTSRLCLSSFVFFLFFLYTYIYKTCLYFSTDRGTYREEAANAWNWWKESVLVQFFCLFYSERSSWTSCGRWEPTPLLSEGLMGNNDCVINMADRYCYQPFF